jgi:hypothetical protein
MKVQSRHPATALDYAPAAVVERIGVSYAGVLQFACLFWFAAGHFILPCAEVQLGGVLVLALPAMLWRMLDDAASRRIDIGSALLIAFLGWMTLRSVVAVVQDVSLVAGEVMRGLIGLALLSAVMVLLWAEARQLARLRLLGWWVCMSAALAVLVSLLVIEPRLWTQLGTGLRFSNILVHGGLNAVCTGLTFGFAALWLAALLPAVQGRSQRWCCHAALVLLHFAVFASGSRGAMMALLAGHGCLLACGIGGRSARLHLALAAVLVVAVFPVWRTLIEQVAAAPAEMLTQLVERGDSGRGAIYAAGWSIVNNAFIGVGQWGARDLWICGLETHSSEVMGHLHSAFFATFVHGGTVGLALLLAVAAVAFRRAWRLATTGEVAWLALMMYGSVGLLFDGESLTSLATLPRLEGLLFWFPAVVALSAGKAPAVSR